MIHAFVPHPRGSDHCYHVIGWSINGDGTRSEQFVFRCWQQRAAHGEAK